MTMGDGLRSGLAYPVRFHLALVLLVIGWVCQVVKLLVFKGFP